MKITVVEKCLLKTLKEANKAGIEIISASIVACVMAVVTIFGNAFMLAVFVKSRNLHTPPNILLAFLCFFDLLVGVILHPLLLAILSSTELSSSEIGISIFLYLLSLCDGFSLIVVTCIALDRYTAVCYPYFYARRASNHHSFVALVATNAVWLLLSFVFFVSETVLLFVCVWLELVIFLTVLFCYVRIYTVIRRQKRTIITIGKKDSEHGLAITTRQQEGKKSKTIAILLILFFICFFPSYIYLIYLLVQGSCDSTIHSSLWSIFLTLSNSAVNPLVYYVSRTDLREAAKILGRRITTSMRPTSNDIIN